MREIKFRAWDGLRMTTSGIMFNCSTGELETPVGAKMSVMQYTGLKGKNGTEIYEGDIILAHEQKANCPLNYVVVFNYPRLAFKMRWVNRFVDKTDTGYYDKTMQPDKYIKFEVIGNIHQNPELLNKE